MKPRFLSPALVVASIALFVALGGVTYAAVKLPANSVGTKQLKKNAVTSLKVKNGSLLRLDFKAGQLGAEGPAGGDLTGTFPNPTIGPDSVDSSKVADGSLTAADIDTSTLAFVKGSGVRRTSDGFIGAGAFADITVPGTGTLRVSCGASSQSGSVAWTQGLVNTQYVTYESATEGGAPTYATDELFGGFGSSATSFGDSATTNLGRWAAFQIITYNGPPVVTATVTLVTRPSGITTSCFYAMEVLGPA